MTRAQAHPDRKGAAHDAKDQYRRRPYDQGVAEVELFYPARLAADENDIHIEYLDGAQAPGDDPRLCRKSTQNKDLRTVFPINSIP
jgi:hypothetical protein